LGAQDPTNRRRWGPGHTRRAAGSLVALLLALTFSVTGCLPDANNDGRRVWLMVGDSNTHFTGCSYPLQLQAQLDPAATLIVDAGVFGSAAWGWIRDDTLAPLLAADPKPDGVVFALGTNDIGSHRTVDQLIADLEALRSQAQAAGVHPFMATIPPRYDVVTGLRDADFEAARVEVNAHLRTTTPATRLVDFDSWMPDTWSADFMCTWYGVLDAVHINCDAHEIRAAVLRSLL